MVHLVQRLLACRIKVLQEVLFHHQMSAEAGSKMVECPVEDQRYPDCQVFREVRIYLEGRPHQFFRAHLKNGIARG